MYYVVVLGGSSAGVAAAVKAAQLGARFALVNAGRLGGTCVNEGCVPRKLLVRAAALKRAAERPYFGGVSAKVEVDGEALTAYIREVVGRLRKEKYEDVLAYYDVEVVEGYGRLRSAREVGGRALEGRGIIVATGSGPRIPEIKGLQETFRWAWPSQTKNSSRRGAYPPPSSS
jgi:Pyruvate/2-oxoglutarate dehydrogenase complex, dihydrolipoamide dehydrogenase (E3) component, and related enzymes